MCNHPHYPDEKGTEMEGKERMGMTVLSEFLSTLQVGEPQVYENLVVFPLLGMELRDPGYLLLDEALVKGSLEVREIDESGSVNEVLVINKGETPVLLMDGEILSGAKQNRVVNISILVAPRVELKIPVSCVEQGRWRYVADGFTESRRFAYAFLRAKKSQQVAENIMSCGVFMADQGAIWEEVGRKQRKMGAESPTGAVDEVYESHENRLRKYCDAFAPQENQVGVAVYINGHLLCLDAFDSPAVLNKMYKKMIESYALDALERLDWRGKKKPDEGAVNELLERIARAGVDRYPSVGLGDSLRLKADGLVGFCLSLEDRVIHLAVFAAEEGRANSGSRLSSPGRRRRSHL